MKSLDFVFATMSKIREDVKTSGRIRTMLQDLIELRQNNWDKL